MKVRATFNEQGLRLILEAENEVEQRMVGAVLNLPSVDRGTEVGAQLLMGQLSYEGHYTNKRVSRLELTVMRNEEPNNG